MDGSYEQLHWLKSWLVLDTRSCSWLLSPNRVLLRNIYASSRLNRHLPAPLVRCALLIVVTFLYRDPIHLYTRIGPLLHSGMILLLHSGVLCYRGYHLRVVVV